MEKVICTSCGNIRYTASPEHVFCECKNRLRKFNYKQQKSNEAKLLIRLLERKGITYEYIINIQ